MGLYMSVFRRMMAKARMKMVSGFWNCRIRTGLQTQYRWLKEEGETQTYSLKQLPTQTEKTAAPTIPKGLHEAFHPLGFSLNFDLSLELSKGIVQVHPGEVHLVQNAAAHTERDFNTPGRKQMVT